MCMIPFRQCAVNNADLLTEKGIVHTGGLAAVPRAAESSGIHYSGFGIIDPEPTRTGGGRGCQKKFFAVFCCAFKNIIQP